MTETPFEKWRELQDAIVYLDDELSLAQHERSGFERRAELIEKAFKRVWTAALATQGDALKQLVSESATRQARMNEHANALHDYFAEQSTTCEPFDWLKYHNERIKALAGAAPQKGEGREVPGGTVGEDFWRNAYDNLLASIQASKESAKPSPASQAGERIIIGKMRTFTEECLRRIAANPHVDGDELHTKDTYEDILKLCALAERGEKE